MANANPFYNEMYGALYQEASNQGFPNPDVLAHLGAAQASQETGYGKHAPGNNYFGIKGQGQKLKTFESVDGQMIPTLASFREYSSMNDSAAGYLDFLRRNPRYRDVLNARTPEEAISLQGKTGYATDPNYGRSLANIYRNNGNVMPPQNNGIINQVMPDQQPQYTPNPILRQNPNAGILERIGNAPGMSEALIQAGAGLLGSTGESNPLATGLSRGLTGFNKGYDQGIENSKARAIPIAGGAFTQITDAQGNVTVVPNSQAQDFLLRQLGIKGQIATSIANNKMENAPKTAAEQKLDDERIDAQNGFKDTKSSVDDLLKFSETYKPGIGTQLAGTGVGKAAADLLSGKSEDAAAASQFQTKLSNVLTNKWLDIGSKLKGAQSDAEGRRLAATLPSPTADYETVIKPWLQSYSKWLESAEKRAAEKLDPNNRYPEGSKFRKDNTGMGLGKNESIVETKDLPPPSGTTQSEDNDPLGLRKKK